MKIFSWKIYNLKKIIEAENFKNLLNSLECNYDIICFQEVKSCYYENNILENFNNEYPFKYICECEEKYCKLIVWSKVKAINIIDNLNIELNKRILSLEFEDFILINTVVPESDIINSKKFNFREQWNSNLFNYIKKIKSENFDKEIIICGDMSVAHKDIDINYPENKKNKVAGFYDIERSDFAYLLEFNDLIDVYREINPLKKKSSFWIKEINNRRRHDNGWRLDYFLTSKNLLKKIVQCDFLIDIKGSNHCPITLEF